MKSLRWTTPIFAVLMTACSSDTGSPASGTGSDQTEGVRIVDGRRVYEDMILDFEPIDAPGSQLQLQSGSFADWSRGLTVGTDNAGHSVPLWTYQQIYLMWSPTSNQTAPQAALLQTALQQWQSDTGVRFIWLNGNAGVPYYVVHQEASTCESGVGQPPSVNAPGNLNIGGCTRLSQVLHEVGHTIGHIHEQQRTDRNQYVTPSASCPAIACDILTHSVFQGLYDYSSIMEYPSPDVHTASGGNITENTQISRYDILGTSIMYAAELEQTTTTIQTGGNSYLFVRGTDGMIWWGTAGTGYSSLGAPDGAPTLGMPAVVSRAANQIDLFVRGINSSIYRNFYNGSRWSGWIAVGGVSSSDPSVVSWGGSRLDVFFRGADSWTDGALWHAYSTDAGASWTLETLNLGTTFIVGTPQAVARVPGGIDLFVRSDDGSVRTASFYTLFGWSAPTNLFGDIVGTPKVVAWDSTRLDLFAQGRNGSLWHKYWVSSTNAWGPSTVAWENLGGNLRGNPEVVSWGPNRLDVFYHATDDKMKHKAWTGSGWYPSMTTDENQDGTLIGTPSGTTNGTNSLNLFVRGTDGATYFKTWNGSVWSVWARIGGSSIW